MLGVATGSSPLPTYRLLVDAVGDGRLSFARASAVLLDEYIGLPPEHPQSYRTFIRTHLTDRVDLDPRRLHGPDVAAADLPAACAAYEELLVELGGVDLQLLGIGSDGHIGFNEPSSSLDVADPDQDADRADPPRQRPVLRRARRGAPATS